MSETKRNRRLNNTLLLLLFLLPCLFWFFAARMTIHRYEARQIAERITGEVIDRQEVSYRCKNSDGGYSTCTHWLYKVRIDVNGDQVTRDLLDARFDPDYREHTDGFDHDAYPVGSTMPLLLRRDLGNAVAPDFFWSAYLMPVVLAGFGLFVSFFVVLGIVLGWEAPKRSTAAVRRG